MRDFTLAAWLDSYRLPLKDALRVAREQGYRSLYGNSAGAELAPQELSGSARRHLAKYLRDIGARLDGLQPEFAGAGLAEPALAERRLALLADTLAMAADLGTRRAAVNIGGLAGEQPTPLALEMLREAADLSDRCGIALAIHDPAADPERLAERIAALGCPTLGVALDSAATPAISAAGALQSHIASVALRDARRTAGGVEETAWGAGGVDFRGWLAALDAAEYDGPLVIRRDGATAGVDAMRSGFDYIGSLAHRVGRM